MLEDFADSCPERVEGEMQKFLVFLQTLHVSMAFCASHRQTMAYFRRSKDISMSKLEMLSDFYHLPMDNFRKGNKYPVVPTADSGSGVGNFSMNSNLVVENEDPRKQVAGLQQQIENLNLVIASKDETNAVFRELVETLRLVKSEQK